MVGIGLRSRPDLPIATELYQLCLELARQHPEDADLVADVDSAWALLVSAYCRHHRLPDPLRVILCGPDYLFYALTPEAYVQYGYRVSDRPTPVVI